MSFRRISSTLAKDILESDSGILLDIRDSESYNISHDKRAVNLTLDSLSDFLNKTSKDMPILIMCYHGNNSQIAAQYLSEQGFNEVYSIDGGYETWED